MRRLVFLLVILIATALSVPATELVVNGGFETGDLTGWTLGGNKAGIAATQNVVLSGLWSAELGSDGSDGLLFQTLTTIPGTEYTLSYLLENATPGADLVNDFGVSWGGVVVPGSTLLDSLPFNPTTFTFTVTATGASTILQFNARNDPGWFYLDNVSVQEAAAAGGIPEPVTLALTGLGLVAIAGVRKLRK